VGGTLTVVGKATIAECVFNPPFLFACRSAGCLFSVNRAYRLCMQADANLVLYNTAKNSAIW